MNTLAWLCPLYSLYPKKDVEIYQIGKFEKNNLGSLNPVIHFTLLGMICLQNTGELDFLNPALP